VRPLVLAVDTTHEYGSIALSDREEVLLHAPAGFAHVLYSHLEEILRRNGVTLGDIDCFAAASGPGSFTGVRVGLACVKGLAEATSRPAASVSNLEALASFGTGSLRAAVLDARRGEVYGAVYNGAGRLVVPEMVAKLPLWLAELPHGVEFVSPDFSVLPDGLPAAPRVTAPRALAGAIARIAARRLERGEACDPAAIDANYVRRSDAELFWKE
jgi:tRNA threonylcarbamoyladenosine biosynthesis protein TsaB